MGSLGKKYLKKREKERLKQRQANAAGSSNQYLQIKLDDSVTDEKLQALTAEAKKLGFELPASMSSLEAMKQEAERTGSNSFRIGATDEGAEDALPQIKSQLTERINGMGTKEVLALKEEVEKSKFFDEPAALEHLQGLRNEVQGLGANLLQVNQEIQTAQSEKRFLSKGALNTLNLTDDKLHELKGKIENLSTEHEALTKELAAVWKNLGLPFQPYSLGDYLHGLLVCGEVRSRGVDVTKEWIASFLKGYSFHQNPQLLSFSDHWRDDAFARVAVGHKLASALMLTSVPDDIEVLAPWKAWVLEIPDGLYTIPASTLKEAYRQFKTERGETPDAEVAESNDSGQVRAIICYNSEPGRLIMQIRGRFISLKVVDTPSTSEISNYVKGVCLSFHDRKHVQERTWGSKGSKREIKEPGQGRHYTFSKPISVDFRDEVKAILSGQRKGHAPRVQFLVRGHWRNQACGKGMKDHRATRIDPYWKGPEESRVLLRGYNLDASKQAS